MTVLKRRIYYKVQDGKVYYAVVNYKYKCVRMYIHDVDKEDGRLLVNITHLSIYKLKQIEEDIKKNYKPKYDYKDLSWLFGS